MPQPESSPQPSVFQEEVRETTTKDTCTADPCTIVEFDEIAHSGEGGNSHAARTGSNEPTPRHARKPESTSPEGAGQANTEQSSHDTSSSPAPKANEKVEEPHIKGKMINVLLCVLAFGILIGYLVFGGEGDSLLEAVHNMRWQWLALSLLMVVLYWVLESGCIQIFANKMHPGFPFLKTNIVTVIGQYFNCITPLSSGGQPFQAYYYYRFGMPLSKSMPMLLCRFITYQVATTTFCALVIIFRFGYFTHQQPALMALVVVGFIGGLFLLAILLGLAFWHTGTIAVVKFVIKIGGKLHIVKDPETTIADTTKTLEDAYKEVHYLIHEPKMLAKSVGLTFVQLLEYFSISYVIMIGLGCGQGVDYISVVSCQAFVYMISSFVPTPGAMGAAEGSYALFFSALYPNASYVALSTFIWRLLTFYFPIVIGMITSVAVNHFDGKIAFLTSQKPEE